MESLHYTAWAAARIFIASLLSLQALQALQSLPSLLPMQALTHKADSGR